MKRFQFRLETLLKCRRMQKEQAQLKVAQAVQNLLEERERLVDMKKVLNENIGIFRDTQAQMMTIGTLKSYQSYFDKIRENIKIQNGRIDEAQIVQQKCLAELQKAVKSCEVVEKLKAKRMLQYQAEALNEEQKFLDELGLQIYVRRN